MDIQEYKNLISDEKGRRAVADYLTSLQKTKGWSILRLILEDRVQTLEKKVLDIHGVDIKDIMEIRIELYYIKELLNMPKVLSEGLLSEEEQEAVEQVYE